MKFSNFVLWSCDEERTEACREQCWGGGREDLVGGMWISCRIEEYRAARGGVGGGGGPKQATAGSRRKYSITQFIVCSIKSLHKVS